MVGGRDDNGGSVRINRAGHSTGGYRQELAKRQVTLPLDIANAGYTLCKSTVKVALKWMQNG